MNTYIISKGKLKVIPGKAKPLTIEEFLKSIEIRK